MKPKAVILVIVAAAVCLSVPCGAQQDKAYAFRVSAATFTAESAKRGENALFQACGIDGTYSLCVTFPSADATDFTRGIYSNASFAKQVFQQGFAGLLIRNTSTDKQLAQDYAMGVSPEGWTSNDKYLHDTGEYLAMMLAENQHDPAKRAIAFKTFLEQYPNSSMKKGALERLIIVQTKSGAEEESVATAKVLLATSAPGDPDRVFALKHLVSVKAHQAQVGVNREQSLEEARQYSETGMQALALLDKPVNYSDEQFAKFKSDATSLFQSVLNVGGRSASMQRASSSLSAPSSATPNAASSVIPTAAYSPASNAPAISGRLSSEQVRATLAAADEEDRQAFSVLVQQMSPLPKALLIFQQKVNQYPRLRSDPVMQEISKLQARLGPSLVPKQFDDMVEMDSLLMGNSSYGSLVLSDEYHAYVLMSEAGYQQRRQHLTQVARTNGQLTRQMAVIASMPPVAQSYYQQKQQVDNAKAAIGQAERALDQGDLIRANSVYQQLAAATPLPPFAQSYLQQTQGFRTDLGAYAEATQVSHHHDGTLLQQVQNLGHEAELLRASESGRPLAKQYLEDALQDDAESVRGKLAGLAAFRFDESSSRVPSGLSNENKLAFVSRQLKNIEDSLGAASESKAIADQPEALKTVADVVGGSEASTFKASAVQISTAERVRASLLETQNTVQAAMEAEKEARERRQAEAAAAKEKARAKAEQTRAEAEFEALGIDHGQSLAEVKELLAAQGFSLSCESTTGRNYNQVYCEAHRAGQQHLNFTFVMARAGRDAYTGIPKWVVIDQMGRSEYCYGEQPRGYETARCVTKSYPVSE